MNSKVISISAISASFIAIFLTLGAYIQFIDLIGVVIASIFVMLPIYLKSYKGSFLAYLAGGIIAFLFSGFNILSIVFPIYFLFFGIFPIIKCIAFDKGFNKRIFYLLTFVWCIIATYIAYFYYVLVIGEENLFAGLPAIVIDYVYIFIAIVGAIFYFVFDKFVFITRILINRYLSRIIK